MRIGGLQKLSLIDYPGRTSAVIFTIGCNMRCGYCHNPELVLPTRFAPAIPAPTVLRWLAGRKKLLEGVVISGGEPTQHRDLPELLDTIKQLGFLVKLDSNGTRPAVLARLIAAGCVDFVALDIKGPLLRYAEICGRRIAPETIRESVELLLGCGVEHEFRTTVVANQLTLADFAEIGELIAGAQRFAIQSFLPGDTLDPTLSAHAIPDPAFLAAAQQLMAGYVARCVVR